MPLSNLLILCGVVGMATILILFPEFRKKLGVLLGGFLNLFVEDTAKTPEGAAAIYSKAIEEAEDKYTKASDTLKRMTGRLDSAVKQRDKANRDVHKHESWSKADITLARDLVVAQADQVIRSGGDLYWHYTTKENEIEAVVYKSLSEPDNIRLGRATPHHADDYNEWIGKCVSIYKALNMDIPSFIACKNMED